MAKKRSNRLGKLKFRFDKRGVITPTKRAIERAMAITAREMGEAVADTMNARYPPASVAGEPPHIRTGKLKGSVHGVVAGGKIRIRMVPYGAHLEKGTRKMAARPFVKPTIFGKGRVRAWKARFVELAERFTEQEVRRFARR